jgi:hypothetical protein
LTAAEKRLVEEFLAGVEFIIICLTRSVLLHHGSAWS